MLAVMETGSKQYHIRVGDIIRTEKLKADPDSIVIFDKVLMLYNAEKAVKIGTPYVKDTKVKAKVLENIKGNKVIVFKKKRRQNYRRKKGHRQNFTILKITGIEGQ